MKTRLALIIFFIVIACSVTAIAKDNFEKRSLFYKKFGWKKSYPNFFEEFSKKRIGQNNKKTFDKWIEIIESPVYQEYLLNKIFRLIENQEFEWVILEEGTSGGDFGSSIAVGFLGKLRDGRVISFSGASPESELNALIWSKEQLNKNAKFDEILKPHLDALIDAKDHITLNKISSPGLWGISIFSVYNNGKTKQVLLSYGPSKESNEVSKDDLESAKIANEISGTIRYYADEMVFIKSELGILDE